MFRVLYPDRWFVWTVVTSIITGVFLLLAINLYTIDIQYNADSYDAQFLDTFNRLHKKQDSSNIDTTNWLTYRNEKYGFEFQYPVSWAKLECDQGRIELFAEPSEVPICGEPHASDFTVFAAGPPSNINLAERQADFYINNLKTVRYYNARIGQDKSYPPFQYVDFLVVNRGQETITLMTDTNHMHSDIVEKIIFTFKFFEPAQ